MIRIRTLPFSFIFRTRRNLTWFFIIFRAPFCCKFRKQIFYTAVV